MLQADKPQEQIVDELQAFMQDRSITFTDWLFRRLARITEKRESGRRRSNRSRVLGDDAHLVKPLLTVESQSSTAAGSLASIAGSSKVGERNSRRERGPNGCTLLEGSGVLRDQSHLQKLLAQTQLVDAHRSRSRQRHRRRDSRQSLPSVLVGHRNGTASGGSCNVEKKVVLTPNANVQRETRERALVVENIDDGRWHFRAPPAVAERRPVARLAAAPIETPPGDLGRWGYGASFGSADELRYRPPSQQIAPMYVEEHMVARSSPPASGGALNHARCGTLETQPRSLPSAPPQQSAPRWFAVKKWRVANPNTIVRATDALDSPEVQVLHEGEIVEQVSPGVRLANGIMRLQIRHPSSPQFPAPIGWVTQDATAAGGPKFLVPGPEPMIRQDFKQPSSGGEDAGVAAWGTRVADSTICPTPLEAPIEGIDANAPSLPAMVLRGSIGHFQNLTWKPSGVGGSDGGEATLSKTAVARSSPVIDGLARKS